MSVPGYRHSYTTDATKQRALFFTKVLKVVKLDRENNSAIAWAKREGDLTQAGIYESTVGNDDALDHGGVEFDDDLF